MKAILEFDLPEDRREFENASNGDKLVTIISDIDSHLRTEVKHGGKHEQYRAACEDIRELLCRELSDAGIILN